MNITRVDFKTGEKCLDANSVLDESKDNFTSLIVIGWDNETYLDVRSTTNLDQKDILYLVEMFKHKLLSGDYAPEE